MSDHSKLDHILWHSFSEGQPQFTIGNDRARRYAPGFSTITANANPDQPDFESLAKIWEVGDWFYCDRWHGDAPNGWLVEKETTMFKMVWDAPIPDPIDHTGMIKLGPEHAERALELAILTNPGPFGLRTFELGDYYGFFEEEQLIAMSGERMYAPPYREVSGVCTHPDYQGRGLAKKLMLRLIRQAMLRKETSFLHVLSHNEIARAMYKKMGFRDHLETTVRIVKRLA